MYLDVIFRQLLKNGFQLMKLVLTTLIHIQILSNNFKEMIMLLWIGFNNNNLYKLIENLIRVIKMSL
jgi:hypothetical protein